MAKDMLDFTEAAKTLTEVKSAFEEFKHAVNEREKEFATKNAVDVLLEEKLARIDADLAEKQAKLDQLHLSMNRSNTVTLDGKSVNVDELDRKAQQWASNQARLHNTTYDGYDHAKLEEYKSAFLRYVRRDDMVLTPDEKKALSVGSDPDGGYVVTPDMSGRMVRREFETSPMRQYAGVQVISTASLEGLYDQDELDFGWVGETGGRPQTGTPQLGRWTIPVHEMYAQPPATQKILDDANVDIETWLLNKISDRFARGENTAFVNGSGTDRPRGFLTYPAGTDNGQIKQFVTGNAAGFAADPNGADVLIDMIHDVKSTYRGNARFFMNRFTVGKARLMKDSDGRMLWQPSIAAGQPSTLLGYAIGELEDMPDVTTADALSVAFGDMNQAYQIVDRLGVRVLRDPYTAKPYVLFYATKRTGGDVIDFEALRLLKTAV